MIGLYWINDDSPARVPSGKRLHNYGISPCLLGKSTISMAIFNPGLFTP